MKIALIGTHGTGKTVLAHELMVALKKQGKNAEFLGEIVRKNPMPINKKATKESQEWVIYNQYVQELEMQNQCEILVCDRSVVDGYVYYYTAHGKNNFLESFVKEQSKKYHALIRVPIKNGFLMDDGVREMDPSWQKKIDKSFNYILKNLEIPFVPYESLEQIIKTIPF